MTAIIEICTKFVHIQEKEGLATSREAKKKSHKLCLMLVLSRCEIRESCEQEHKAVNRNIWEQILVRMLLQSALYMILRTLLYSL